MENLECSAAYDHCSGIWPHFCHLSNGSVWQGIMMGVESFSVPWFKEKTHLTIK
jgi:hypothetical protein